MTDSEEVCGSCEEVSVFSSENERDQIPDEMCSDDRPPVGVEAIAAFQTLFGVEAIEPSRTLFDVEVIDSILVPSGEAIDSTPHLFDEVIDSTLVRSGEVSGFFRALVVSVV